MDLSILKKKISTYRSETGKLMNVSDELLMELLLAWEGWSGPAAGFYAALGVDHRKMAKLMGRAKKLKREGVFPESGFKEIKLESPRDLASGSCGIELSWENGRVIRFAQVELLVDFLKKVAA
jgi:hypothetical protein